MAPAPARAGSRRTGWIVGVAALTTVATLLVYLALVVLLGPTGFIIALLAWLGLLATGAAFLRTDVRRATGIGLLGGALLALVVAVVIAVLSN